MADQVKIALLQTKSSPDPRKNLEHAAALVRRAAQKGARIICLQELFLTPYFCREEKDRYFSRAEPIPGPVTDRLSALARKEGVVLIAPLFEKRARGLYHNSAVVFDSGKILGTYRKMHLPDDPGFHEKFYFAPGDLGFPVFKTRFATIGVLICWDQWYPEAARISALQGAEILFYPTAIGAPFGTPKMQVSRERDAWITVQTSHAVVNGIYVACVNRVGREGKLVFWGSSFVAAPDGALLKKASLKEEIILADCDLGMITRTRVAWPFLRDRRIDAYKPLLNRWGQTPGAR